MLEWAKRSAGDRYRVIRAAGAGGHSLVFEAFDARLERPVAIKFLRRSANPDAPLPGGAVDESLLAEARAMARLRHEGLCPVHEIESSSIAPFLVMEWIDGVPLDAAWAGTSRDQKLASFIRIVDAVAVLHAAGIVHGDLKPSNVLADRRSRPVVVDFGLATKSAASRGRPFGTPGFAAPEQLGDRGVTTPGSDVFSLGAILYLLLTGVMAISGDSVDACRRRAIAADYPLPQELSPECPAPLQRICLAALEPDSRDRYQSAEAMLEDLERYRRGEEVAARPKLLDSRFFGQVDSAISDVDKWRLQSLITDREANGLLDLLRRVRRPDSFWIVDARRLSLSQVTLYLGGWASLVALTLGMVLAWDAFKAQPWLRWAIPSATAILLAGVGLWLRRRHVQRIALGFFLVVDLAVAVAVFQVLRETGWLMPMAVNPHDTAGATQPAPHLDSTQLISVLDRCLPPARSLGGLANGQLAIISASWLVASLLLRRLSGSSALTPMASVAGLLLWLAGWAWAGCFDRGSDLRNAATGAWLAVGGAMFLWIALRRHTHEERTERAAGEGVALPHDAWSIAAISVVSLLVGVAFTAWWQPGPWTLGLLDGESSVTRRAAAFMVASIPIIFLAAILQRHRTPLRARLATFVRLTAPSWVLAPLLALEHESSAPLWIMWQGILFAAILACAAMSALQNWKPFLLSSLIYFAFGYASLVGRVGGHADDSPTAAMIVMLVVLAGGVIAMMIAYAGPRLLTAAPRRPLRAPSRR